MPAASTAQLTADLKAEAARIGFTQAGVCPAVSPAGAARLAEWIAAGYAGEMRYLVDRRDAYQHPDAVLDGVRSIVVLAMDYRTAAPAEPRTGQGRVARYAWGARDYHDVIHERLKNLRAWLLRRCPEAAVRGVVDSAPLLEREFAQLAGLGWIGKNTLLLNKHAGSWFFLAALLVDVELSYDAAHLADHCGSCTACLDACPTDAFPRPYVLDATRCISYLTIETRGSIPADMRPGMGDWLFGCDICQDVCPWNRQAPPAQEESFAPLADMNPVDLAALFELTDEQFRRRFRRTPLWRPKRRGILRNAAIVLGNQRDPSAIDALARGLQDEEPVVRAASAWALGQIDDPRACRLLQQRAALEIDAEVAAEIATAVNGPAS